MGSDHPLAARLPRELNLSDATPGDRRFLLEVYAATREDELAQTDWPPEAKHAFVLQQFEAQDQYYRENVYPDADYLVITHHGESAGRLYLQQMTGELRIVDITLLPAFRGRGLGTTLLTALQDECSSSGSSLSIHVERFNPALRLYQRLGFEQVEDKGVYLFMKWHSSARS